MIRQDPGFQVTKVDEPNQIYNIYEAILKISFQNTIGNTTEQINSHISVELYLLIDLALGKLQDKDIDSLEQLKLYPNASEEA